jgi:hypothetical protein
MKKIILYFLPILSLLLLALGCQKDFLDTKPNKALLIPTKLSDMQALLDNLNVFNITPGITNIADGDFYTTDAAFKTWSIDAERNSYTWNAEIWGTATTSDWDRPWQQVFYANVVLDGLKNLEVTGEYNAIKGTALFSRAFAYYHLLLEFGGTELGMPIRLSSDVNERPVRASLQATYEQIITDLNQARNLVPATTIAKNRPNTAAVFALLAKVYLVMGNYTSAGKYADSCLQKNAALIDYNTLSATAARPFPRAIPSGNDEVIYYSSAVAFSSATNTATLADTTLFRSYAANDLRKTILYKASGLSGTFKGNYAGIVALFSGLATDELYLVRAECAARNGNTAAALGDLNALLSKRWKTGTYVPLSAGSAEAALNLIITERRKELAGRLIRWSDLKRLRSDSRFAVTLSRKINGQVFSLTPDSRRYAYPIPFDETSASAIQQNER